MEKQWSLNQEYVTVGEADFIKKIILCILCIGIAFTGIIFLGYRNKKYPFAGEKIREAKMVDSVSDYMLNADERKALAKILHNMQGQKSGSDIRNMVLHSSRSFQVETKKASYVITLYGKVGEVYLCAINQERYHLTENTYHELYQLYEDCFRNVHKELFEGFQNSKFLRVTSGSGKYKKEFSDSEIEEVAIILQSMSILGKAEENLELYLGVFPLSIETDKDSFLIYVLPLYDEEGVVCCFNGLNYLIDKDNGEKLFGME